MAENDHIGIQIQQVGLPLLPHRPPGVRVRTMAACQKHRSEAAQEHRGSRDRAQFGFQNHILAHVPLTVTGTGRFNLRSEPDNDDQPDKVQGTSFRKPYAHAEHT